MDVNGVCPCARVLDCVDGRFNNCEVWVVSSTGPFYIALEEDTDLPNHLDIPRYCPRITRQRHRGGWEFR